jgi:heavy metal sensor kinase
VNWHRPKRLRTRLALWYVAMFAAVLAVYFTGVSLLLFWQGSNILKRIAAEDLETLKGLLYFEDNGRLNVREDYHHHTDWKQVQERLLEVLSPDGKILYRNEKLGDRTLGGPPFTGEGEKGYSGRSAKMSDGAPIILISRTYVLSGQPMLIRVGYSQDLIWNQLKQTLLILLATSPLILAGMAYAVYTTASRALDPVDKMTSRAEQITSNRLNERVPVENTEDELGHLASVFNAMLARIEQSFEELKRFTADASHELRTPLASIRSIGEVGLQESESADDYRETIGSMLEETNRLTQIVGSLLTLSQADAGQIRMQVSVFPLMALVRESAALLEVLIEEKRIAFTLEGDPNAGVQADRLYLRQAVVNILHNAVKFTPAGGSIQVRIECASDSRVELRVHDSGPGISGAQAERVFERFYRADEARSGENRGAGLGLSIAQWAVRANNGEIGLSNSDRRGATFWIRLPAIGCARRSS